MPTETIATFEKNGEVVVRVYYVWSYADAIPFIGQKPYYVVETKGGSKEIYEDVSEALKRARELRDLY